MTIKKISEKYNALLKRRELVFQVDHPSAGTPGLLEVRKILASKYNVDQNLIYIKKLKTLRGTNQSIGLAEIYESEERAERVVPKYIKKRNPKKGQ